MIPTMEISIHRPPSDLTWEGLLKGQKQKRLRLQLLNTEYFLREYCTPPSSISSERNLLGENSHGYGDRLYKGTPIPSPERR